MKHLPEHIKPEEIEQIRQWLQAQSILVNIAPEDYMGLILYKLLELEERLKKIEYNQQTHWVN